MQKSPPMLSMIRRWLRFEWPVVLILAGGLAISGSLAWLLYRQALVQDEARFNLESAYIAATIEQAMERYEERLGRLADYCAQFDEVPGGVWNFRQAYMTDLQGNLPSIMLAAYCPKVSGTNSQAPLQAGQENSESHNLVLKPASGRKYSLPISRFWRREGFPPLKPRTDLAIEEVWHPSFLEALSAANGWMSPRPCQVKRESGATENGFWFAQALFKTNQLAPQWTRPNETDNHRATRIAAFKSREAIGILAAFISADRLIDESFNSGKGQFHIHVRLYAANPPAPSALLNPRSDPPAHPRHKKLLAQSWYPRHWTMELASTPLFEKESPRGRAWLVLGAGSASTIMAAGLASVSLSARRRQELMTAEVIEARNALVAADHERERLGRDLHDNSIQALYAIQLGLGHTAQKLRASPDAALSELSTARAELDSVIEEIRRFILVEEPASNFVDLAGVLRSLAQRAAVGTAAQIQATCDPAAASALSPQQAVQLANITREALSNSLRHARPARIEIQLRASEREICLEITDDGIGFDENETTRRGMGLASMRKRAQEIDAIFDLRSSKSAGTSVLVRIPASTESMQSIASA